MEGIEETPNETWEDCEIKIQELTSTSSQILNCDSVVLEIY